MRSMTPAQVKAELEAGTELYVPDDKWTPTLEDSALVTRVIFFENSFLGVYKNKARIFIREDEISDETWYTLDLSSRIGRLLLMLMLARIDGKSPVEYIVEEQKKECVRQFVGRLLPAHAFAMEEIIDNWRRLLVTQ